MGIPLTTHRYCMELKNLNQMKTISLIIISLVGLLIVSGLKTAPIKKEPKIVIPNYDWDDTLDSSYVDKYGDTIYTKKDATWKEYY